MLRLVSSLFRLSWCVPWVIIRATADAVLPAQYRVRTGDASHSPDFDPANRPGASGDISPPVDRSPPDHGYGTTARQFSAQPAIATGPIEQENNMTTNFYDSNVTTVDYQIIFTKRDFEAILEKGTTAVAKAMSGSGFASWKIAEFIRQMDEEGINRPREWTEADAEELAEMVDGKVKRLRPKNFEYLQVEYQVLSTLDRKPARYEEDKVDALQEIARKLPKETHWKTD